MSLLILKPGLLTTIQDLGRTGKRALGVNPSGVMDVAATRIINRALGNADSAAVLEMHFPAAVIEFTSPATVAIGGADFGAELNGTAIPNWSRFTAVETSVLKFTGKSSGSRAYLAVSGGLCVDPWLGSASTNLAIHRGGFNGRKLEPGDVVGTADVADHAADVRIGQSVIPRYSRFPTVRVITANEFDLLTAESERSFLNDGFTLTGDSDRMGYRLSGKRLHLLDQRPMISAGVSFGTIQLLPDGQLVVLMADHQTSGGYPRLGNVIQSDLPLLAQCGPGDGVSFELVSISDAERLSFEFELMLSFLEVGCRLQKQNATR